MQTKVDSSLISITRFFRPMLFHSCFYFVYMLLLQLVEDLDLKKNWYVTDAVFACFLIKHGANPMLKNTSGYNAFSTATRSEVLATVKRFYEA